MSLVPPAGGELPPTLPARLLLGAVRGYRRRLSPLKAAPTCRFTPSCSEYALEALELHGAFKGSWLAAWRVLRCHPLTTPRHDPVPPRAPSDRSRPAHPSPSPESVNHE